MSRGGKHIRPILGLIIWNYYKQNNLLKNTDENLLNDMLISLELIHNGTLIIDDIEDSSDYRRN